jgi:membrane protein required for colicin V production
LGVDLVLLGLLLVFTIYGFIKGFIHEVFVTLGLILGVWLGIKKSYLISSLSPPILLPEPWNQVVSFIIIFAAVFLITMLLRLVIKKFISAIELEWMDRVIGGIYGFIQGVVIIWALLLVILIFNPGSAGILNQSSVSNRILSLGKNMPNLSGELTRLKNRITEFFTKTKITEKETNKTSKHRTLI